MTFQNIRTSQTKNFKPFLRRLLSLTDAEAKPSTPPADWQTGRTRERETNNITTDSQKRVLRILPHSRDNSSICQGLPIPKLTMTSLASRGLSVHIQDRSAFQASASSAMFISSLTAFWSFLFPNNTSFALAMLQPGCGRLSNDISCPASTWPDSCTRMYQPVRPVCVTCLVRVLSPQRRAIFQHGCRG